MVMKNLCIRRPNFSSIRRIYHEDHVNDRHEFPLAHCRGNLKLRARCYYLCAPLFICATSPRSPPSLTNLAYAIQWHYFANGPPMKRRPSVGRSRAEYTECWLHRRGLLPPPRTLSPHAKNLMSRSNACPAIRN